MDDQLRSRLEQLHGELRTVDPDDPAARSAASSLKSAVATILEQPEADSDHRHESLYRQLRESLLQFEAVHPTLTASIENVIDTLVQLGV
jgi:hypothetical protein